MKITLDRFSDDKLSTTGLFKINGVFECFTLEDQHQWVKKYGETRISGGRYKIVFNTEPTPMTMRYREKYDFFKFHLMLVSVPRFKNVYIHIGNEEEDTDGCILVGDSAINKGTTEDFLGHSTQAYKRIYLKIKSALDRGEDVIITIRDS